MEEAAEVEEVEVRYQHRNSSIWTSYLNITESPPERMYPSSRVVHITANTASVLRVLQAG